MFEAFGMEWLALKDEKEKEKRKKIAALLQESNPGPFTFKSMHYSTRWHVQDFLKED